MLCEQAREHLSAYLDRELASELSVAVRAHLESCADCRALLADLRATAGLLGALPVHRAPADLAEDVQREIERCIILPAAESDYDAEPQERTLALRRVRLWPKALAVAASVLLVVGIGVLALLGPAGRRGRLDEASGPETVPALRSSGHEAEVAKDGEIGVVVGSAAALAKKEAVGDFKAAEGEAGRVAQTEEGGWGGGQTDLAKVPERARAGPPDLEHAAKAPGPDSLAEETDRTGRLRVAEKPSGDERTAVLEVQRAMNQAANGEVPIDELKQVATVSNLRLARNNTLVIETDAPAEANEDLTRLFGANDWQPVAPPPAVAGARVERLGKAVDKAGAPARAAAPNGYYFLAHSDGEYVWVIVADRDYITRFSSQLASDERLRVGSESGRQFQAIRTLQDEVRQYNLEQRKVRYVGKAAAPTAAPPVEESVAAKTRAEQERAGRDDALALTGAAPSPPAEVALADSEPTPVPGEKAETSAATQAIPTLQRPVPAKEPAGLAPGGGEQKAPQKHAWRTQAAPQAPAAPASRALAGRERRETNGTFSYEVRLPANQDLLVIRVQRPGVSADVTATDAAEEVAKPAVESGH